MLRDWDLSEWTDGKKYGVKDMVKAGCGDCAGCFSCCQGMGESVLLDPLDIHRLMIGLGRTFNQLLDGYVELNLVEGLILPNLSMTGVEERCACLDEQGRCSIHPFRPGICRIFPLGRVYEKESFYYILQDKECIRTNRTKVKVSKWIDTPNLVENQKFIACWHYFTRKLQEEIMDGRDEQEMKQKSMSLLQMFYIQPYGETEGFYREFYERLEEYQRESDTRE